MVSDLVRRAYAKQSITHIFGDTTLEFPGTLRYIEEFRRNHPTVPFLNSKSDHDFFELSREIGPPSRVMRWCCTVFKTGPIGQAFDGLRDLGRPIVTYYGIREIRIKPT